MNKVEHGYLPGFLQSLVLWKGMGHTKTYIIYWKANC